MTADKLTSSLFLIGFMGAGKSTLGGILARLTGAEWIDLDALIVEQVGLSIPEIFSRFGEETFRWHETAALLSLAQGPPRVVATGGGVVGREENLACMRAQGVVVYLQADWAVLSRRIGDGAGRPLAQGAEGERLQQLWRQRLPLYEQADLIVDASLESPEEVARRILEAYFARRDRG